MLRNAIQDRKAKFGMRELENVSGGHKSIYIYINPEIF